MWTGIAARITARPMTFSVRSLQWLFALLAASLVSACGDVPARGPVVLAPVSMQEALGEVADAWATQGNAPPVLSFAGTQVQARQLAQGAPADLIVTADEEWMDWLETRALVEPPSRRTVTANGLVLVSATAFGPDDTIESRLLALGDERLALADPQSVPAGRYARAALENMGLWDVVAARVVPAENVRAALALVESGEAALGIVYRTDAEASPRVASMAFDFRDVPKIYYPAALVTGAAHPRRQAFLDFLSTPAAQEILAAHRFVPVEQAP